MRRLVKTAVAAGALTLVLALSGGAEARTLWLCTPPGEDERTFVSAAEAARLGIERANEKAGRCSAPSSVRVAAWTRGPDRERQPSCYSVGSATR
jgi:hypothetical protein